MPDPTTNNKPDSYYVDRTISAIDAGRSIDGDDGLRKHLMAEPNMSEERVNKIIGEASQLNETAKRTLPSEESKTDFGLFGGTKYKEYSDQLGAIDKELTSIDTQISSADDSTTSIGYRGESYVPLIERKIQLKSDRNALLGQKGRVIREAAARFTEAGTFYVTDDGVDSPGYSHSAEREFLNAGADYLNNIDHSLNAEVNEDGQIVATWNNQRRVIEPEFFDTFKAQFWETSLGFGLGISAGVATGIARGRILGAPGAVVGGAAGALGAGVGAAIDTATTLDMIDEMYENSQENNRGRKEAEALLDKYGLGKGFVSKKALDAAAFEAVAGSVAGGIGEMVGRGVRNLAGLWGHLKGDKASTSKKALETIFKDTATTREEAIKGKNEWLKSVAEDETVKVGRRNSALDWAILPDWVKKADTKEVRIRDLPEDDQIALYMLKTHPDLTGAITQILKTNKSDSPRILIDEAIEREKLVKGMISDGAPYLPTHVFQNLFSFRKGIRRAHAKFGRSLDSAESGYKSHEPVNFPEVVKAFDNEFKDSQAAKDFIARVKAEADRPTYKNTPGGTVAYSSGTLSGKQFTSTYNKFIIDAYKEKNYNKRELLEIQNSMERLINTKYGPEAKKDFNKLADLHKRFGTLTGQAMFQELKKSGLNKTDVAAIFLKYGAFKQANDTQQSYRNTVVAAVRSVFERRDLAGANKGKFKISKKDPLRKIKLEADDSTEDAASFIKSVEAGKGFDAEESLELGAMQALLDVHSVRIGAGESGHRAVDWVALRESARHIQWRSKKAQDVWKVTNYFGTVFKNDIGIVAATKHAGTSLIVSSGSSIATTLEGKIQVQLASALYETILSNLGDNRYSRAREITEGLTFFAHGDPTKVKNADELLKSINGGN